MAKMAISPLKMVRSYCGN